MNKKNEAKVVLKAIERQSWSGFHRFPKCKDTVIASLGRGGYATGLTVEEEKDLEQELQMTAGTLGKYSEYWKDYTVILNDKDKTLTLSSPRDFIDYKILMASNRVSNSVNDMTDWPKAEYVLYDAEEDAKKDNLKVKSRRSAYKVFNAMTSSEMRNVLKLMGKKAENASDTLIENTLADIIEKDPVVFNETMNMSDFKLRVFVNDLVSINGLRIRGGHYMFGDSAIGHDLEAALLYLKDPVNQDIVLSLKQKLKATKK
jgi:hypothetical protein|tara:strand:- start:3764 stop:4540 length:777 start_codon:yes stop_codon:yes gene_type:complete